MQFIDFPWAGTFKKGEKMFILNTKKFGSNIRTLIFALPKRNSGKEREEGNKKGV
jgi:hypothetical protein